MKGQTNRLCCSSNSWPSIKTMMLLKDQTVTKETRYNSSTICLTLMNITDLDGGKYSCFAENEVGMDISEIDINVLSNNFFMYIK